MFFVDCNSTMICLYLSEQTKYLFRKLTLRYIGEYLWENVSSILQNKLPPKFNFLATHQIKFPLKYFFYVIRQIVLLWQPVKISSARISSFKVVMV